MIESCMEMGITHKRTGKECFLIEMRGVFLPRGSVGKAEQMEGQLIPQSGKECGESGNAVGLVR